ncbi:MAG: response regulator [Bacteroidota bacterium]
MADSRTVLVVDDDPVMLAFLERAIGAEYTVATAPDGAAALERARGGSVDLVVADLMMPRLDGFAFTEALRADERTERLPLLILSGSDTSADRIRCLRLGADDFVAKPFNPEELMARIANLFRRIG